MPKMKRNYKRWSRGAVLFALVICLAFVFDGLFLRQFNLDFHYDIQLTEVIGVIVTIVLALYLAHVVEEHREQKKAKTEILTSILGGLLADVDSLSNQIFDSQLPYARLSTFTKMASTKLQSLEEVITSLEIENTDINASVSAIKNKLQYLRPILSSTKEKTVGEDDYLVVSEGIVNELAERRISKIQSNLSSLRKLLYSVWLTIISLE